MTDQQSMPLSAELDEYGDPLRPDPRSEDWYDGYAEGQRDAARERPSALDVETLLWEELRFVKGATDDVVRRVARAILARLTDPDAGEGTADGVRDALDRPTGPMFTPDTTEATLESAYRIALSQIEHDGEVINRLTRALRVANHRPHDRNGEPNEGFPTCSGCGAILTTPDTTETTLRALEDEGVVTWGNAAHRGRWLAARAALQEPAVRGGPE